MPLSYTQYIGDGTTKVFNLSFAYIHRDHVFVSVNGINQTFTWLSATQVQLTNAPASGDVIDIRRKSPRDKLLVDFKDASTLVESDLDLSALHSFFLAQETLDLGEASLGVTQDGSFDALQRKISNVQTPTVGRDAANKDYVDNGVNSGVQIATAQAGLATTAAAGAKASETNSKAAEAGAKVAEGIAKDSIIQSKASETAAKTSETNSKTSETAAKTAETGAKGAETAAKQAETNARAAETGAKTAETNAKGAETAAKGAENGAKAAEAAVKATQQTLLNDISAGVDVLSAGANPTANYNPAERRLTFGIPTPTFPVTLVTNWNDANYTGHFRASSGAANAPATGAFVGHFVAFDGVSGVLTITDVTTGNSYDRHRNQGSWGIWRKTLKKEEWQQLTNVLEILNSYLRLNRNNAIWDINVASDGNLHFTRSGHSGFSVAADGNIHLPSVGWLRNGDSMNVGQRARYATGGTIRMDTGHNLDFHWNDGLHYRVDWNGWVMINRNASDRNFKEGREFTADPLGELKALKPRRYEALQDTVIAMPKGERDGFYAQELEEIDPALVDVMPVPEAKNGETFYALASDASFQLIAKLTRAMQAQQSQIEALETKLQELTNRVSALA